MCKYPEEGFYNEVMIDIFVLWSTKKEKKINRFLIS
jgi:hypothetical protein